MSAIDVTVVIPTYDRETRLAFALEALAEQTLARDRFEVIVVRAPNKAPQRRRGSASPSGLRDRSGLLTEAPPDLEVTFLRGEVAGPAAQRNVGWRAARGRLVAFTDDDCRPAADWLERLLAAEPAGETILQGRTIADPDERHLLLGFARSMEVERFDPWAPTCNIAYPRALLERVDGFDESFADAWGEDTDLALRAIAAGAEQHFIEDAVVRHAVLPRRLGRALGDAVRRSDIHIVVARHPQQRAALDMRLFTKRRHAWVLLGFAGLAFARRHPLAALAAWAPYLRTYRPGPGVSLGRRLWWLAVVMPRRLLLDSTHVGAMAVSSVRHRTPVI
jgi:glycosyltransferase involved in cell wall biosynthesis